MAEVLLFHHAQGLTEGVRVFAGRLRSAGHDVSVPDLYEGATFETIGEGVAHADQLGFENLVAAGVAVAEDMTEDLVYAGFSLGALVAHKLAQTRSGARGGLLYHHGDVSIDAFAESWPAGVDLQIHIAEDDPYHEPEVVSEFVERADRVARAELFVYPGAEHLFADSSLPGYDPAAASLLMERTLEFLDRVS